MDNAHISLDMFSGMDLGLIIPRPTGIIYSNQAEGCACIRLELEGFYIPFGFWPERTDRPNYSALEQYFVDEHGNRGCLDAKDADFIDNFLLPAELPFTAKVDRERLTESYEAWVWLNLADYKHRDTQLHTKFAGPLTAVLVWPNSD